MVEPLYCASRGLEALADRIIDRAVSNNDVATFAECGNDAGDGGKGLGIDNTALGTKVGGNVGFSLDVDVLRAVKLRGAARANAVCSEGLDSFLLDLFVGVEIIEVVRSEVRYSPAVRELRLRPSGTVSQC